jgi:hypothetical protein
VIANTVAIEHVICYSFYNEPIEKDYYFSIKYFEVFYYYVLFYFPPPEKDYVSAFFRLCFVRRRTDVLRITRRKSINIAAWLLLQFLVAGGGAGDLKKGDDCVDGGC